MFSNPAPLGSSFARTGRSSSPDGEAQLLGAPTGVPLQLGHVLFWAQPGLFEVGFIKVLLRKSATLLG